jgi:hypothetical protein
MRCILCNSEIMDITKSFDYCLQCYKTTTKECYECSTKMNAVCTHGKEINGTISNSRKN